MPWVGKDEYREGNRLLRETQVKVAELQARLDAETSRRERAELDYDRLQHDFKGLVALTAGRVPPKAAPEFDKDPFAEIETQAVTFLSPDPDDFSVSGEEILRNIEEARLKDDDLSG